MKTFYAAVTDRTYVGRVLCLYRSLQPWLGDKRFGFFCMDDEAAMLLEALHLPHAVVVRHEEFATPALGEVKPMRMMNEYCWTCKPAALQYACSTWPELDWVVYLDGDMMAFGDPDLALDRLDAQVLITPHRFVLEKFRIQEPETGTHNGGYAAFRNAPEGRAALDWWMERCLELCPAVRTRGVYADQTYLDDMLGKFSNVAPSSHKGLNAAPWNIDGYHITVCDGQVYCDEDPLLIYHFQGMQLYGLRFYDMYAGPHRMPKDAVCHIYRPHLNALAAAMREVRRLRPGYTGSMQSLLTKPKKIYHQLRRVAAGTSNLYLVLK